MNVLRIGPAYKPEAKAKVFLQTLIYIVTVLNWMSLKDQQDKQKDGLVPEYLRPILESEQEAWLNNSKLITIQNNYCRLAGK